MRDCWRHDWTKWGLFKVAVISSVLGQPPMEGLQTRQKRTCKTCGFTEIREVIS